MQTRPRHVGDGSAGTNSNCADGRGERNSANGTLLASFARLTDMIWPGQSPEGGIGSVWPPGGRRWLQARRGRGSKLNDENRMDQLVARGLRLVVAAALSMGVLGCVGCAATPSLEPIRSSPDFIAFIVEAERSEDQDLQGLILAESHADKIVTRYLVRALDSTAIFVRRGESYSPAKFGALEAKQWIWIWFAEPAPEEFGATVDALQVAIISD